MNPWYIAAALAGVYGISRLSAASTAAATAAKAKGTEFRPPALQMATTPAQKIQNALATAQALIQQWASATDDSWLDTNHNAIAQAENGLITWRALLAKPSYTNANPGLSSYGAQVDDIYTIINAMSHKYWADPSKPAHKGFFAGLLHKAGAGGTTQLKSAKDLISKAQGIISSFPSDGSDASAYLAWTATSAAQVPGIVSDIQSLVANASNTQQDIQAAMAFIPQLTQLVAKAASSASSSSSSGGGDGTSPITAPSDGSSA